jgi:hypothetical protein
LRGKHELFVALFVGVCTAIKAGHCVIQNPIKLHGENALAIIVTNLLSKVKSRRPTLLVVRDICCRDCRLGLCFRGCNTRLMDFELIRIQGNTVIKRVQLFQATFVSAGDVV